MGAKSLHPLPDENKLSGMHVSPSMPVRGI